MDRGEIYDAELDPPGTIPGHEQTGFRPVLVISPRAYNNRSLFVAIIPFTRNLNTLSLPYTVRVNPSTSNGLSDPSVLLVLQFRALDNRRLRARRFRGVIEPDILANAMRMIREMV